MSDFFRKLNTLISSQINDVIRPIASDDQDKGRKRVARDQIRQGLTREVDVLRKRIADAQEYQQTLQNRVDKLAQEVQRWDIAADQALAEGRQLDARFALERLQKAQSDLDRTQNDLREHQQVTDELVSKVDYLDYVVNQPEADEIVDEPPQPARSNPIRVERDTPSTDSAATEAATPSVHVLGQAPTRKSTTRTVKTEAPKPADTAPRETPDSVKKISVRVEMDDEPSVEPSVTEVTVQTAPAPAPENQPSTQEKAIRKRRSKYAQIGDDEYAEGVELAKSITQRLDQTQDKMTELAQEAAAPMERDVLDEVRTEVDKAAVDEELNRRISRLSRPAKPAKPDEPTA